MWHTNPLTDPWTEKSESILTGCGLGDNLDFIQAADYKPLFHDKHFYNNDIFFDQPWGNVIRHFDL